MFCPKCGKSIGEDAVFCDSCGYALRDSVRAEQQKQKEKATIYFCPKRIPGQWILRKSSIEVENKTISTKINRFSKIEVDEGEQNFECYCNYFGKTGLIKDKYKFEGGKNYILNYRSPLIVFMKGKLSIVLGDLNTEEEILNKQKRRKFLKLSVFAAIIIIVLFALLRGCGEGEVINEVETPINSEQVYDENSEFAAVNTPYEFYKYLSENLDEDDNFYFKLNQKASTFLKNNETLFPTSSIEAVQNVTDFALSFAHIAKNDSKYGDQIMCIPVASVVQISETEIQDGKYLSELNIIDEVGNQYYVFYIGELPNILENQTVTVYGLPLSMSKFDNTDGGQTLCPILAGSCVFALE